MRRTLLLLLWVLAPGAWAQAPEASSPPPPPAPLAPPLVKALPGPAPEPVAEPVAGPAAGPGAGQGLSRPLVLRQGEWVRVGIRGAQPQTGALTALTPEGLSLTASPEQVVNLMLSDVLELETRQRAVGQGALVGGGIGAGAGALLLALLCVAVGEGDDSAALPCAGIGGLIGGAFGAGTGALVGLALPRWATVYERATSGPLSLRLSTPEHEDASGVFSGKGPIGEVGLQLGYGRDVGISMPAEGWGGRLHMLALLGPYFAVGPEVAWYSNIGTEVIDTPFSDPFTRSRSLFQLQALGRAGVEIGPTRTGLLLGMGLHLNRTSHMGVSVGGEVEVSPVEGLPPLALDVRFHTPLSRSELEPVERYLTFGLGTRLRW